MSSSHARLALASLMLSAVVPAAAATALDSLRYSADATIVLGGETLTDHDVGVDDLIGGVATASTLGVPAPADLDGYHRYPDGTQLFSLDTAAELPSGLRVRPGDVVSFDGLTYSLVLDASAEGVPDGANVDAIAVDGNGDLLISFDVAVDLGGTRPADEDLVRFDGASFVPFFDGSAVGVPAAADLNAAHRLPANGRLLLSFDMRGAIGAVIFAGRDVLEHDPVSEGWEVVYAGESEHAGWAAANLDALYAKGLDDDGDGVLLSADCDDFNPDTYPDAPEVNDGLDNQCPGDEGFGLSDEISGTLGFSSAGNPEICWPGQSGATSYEVARADDSAFQTNCTLFQTAATCLTDFTLPAQGQAYFYLVHALTPNVGSWGANSNGIERLLECP